MLQPCSSQPHQSPHLHGFPFPACPPLPPAALWLLQRLHCPPGLEEQPQPPDKRHSAASPSLMLLLLTQGRWHPQVASAQRGGTGVGSAGCFSSSVWGGPACPPGAGGEQESRTRMAQQQDTRLHRLTSSQASVPQQLWLHSQPQQRDSSWKATPLAPRHLLLCAPGSPRSSKLPPGCCQAGMRAAPSRQAESQAPWPLGHKESLAWDKAR